MTQKINGNDLCSCDSGKKYKECCMIQSPTTSEILDFSWAKLRQTEGGVIDDHLLPYVATQLSEEMLTIALDDLLPDELSEKIDEELLFDHFFIPWFLFNWIPLENFGIEQFDPEKTIAQNYIQQYEKKLSPMEKNFIEAINQSYYSFYSVLEVEFEKSIIVKDILLGTLHTLKERRGTHCLKRGDVVFSRILTLDDQSIFVGMAPFTLPAKYQIGLLDFKKWLIEENENQPLTPVLMRNEFETDLIDYFFDAINACFEPPILLNTDGDPIIFSKSYFKLDITPEAALQKLLPLTLEKDPEIFLQDAELNKSGSIKRIEIPWLKKGNKKHKDWDNTLAGEITVSKNKLILNTNSEKRAKHGRKLIEKHLGKDICFQKMSMQTPQQKLKSSPKSREKNQSTSESEMLNSPETQAHLKQMIQAHWENWFDESIPALNHQTPREAAKTAEGKERLEALLLQYERYDAERKDNLLKADIHYLRAELGLDD